MIDKPATRNKWCEQMHLKNLHSSENSEKFASDEIKKYRKQIKD